MTARSAGCRLGHGLGSPPTPAWTIDPYGIWDGLRQHCLVAHTDRYKGVYFPTRYQDIRDIAYDYENFWSRRVVVRESDYRVNSLPITSDPPDHRRCGWP